MSMFKERDTEGMPDMMPKGTVDNPPQKEPQDVPDRMVDQPYGQNGKESRSKKDCEKKKDNDKDDNICMSDYYY